MLSLVSTLNLCFGFGGGRGFLLASFMSFCLPNSPHRRGLGTCPCPCPFGCMPAGIGGGGMKGTSIPNNGPGGGGTNSLSSLKNGSGPNPPWSRARARASSRHTSSSMSRRSTSSRMIRSRLAAASHSICGGGGGGPPCKAPGRAARERRLSVSGESWSAGALSASAYLAASSAGRGGGRAGRRGDAARRRRHRSETPWRGGGEGFGESMRPFERHNALEQ